MTSSWGEYSNVEIEIINNGDEIINGWFVDYYTNGSIDNIWDAKISDGNYTLRAMNYNSLIYPNTSVTFGFIIKNDDFDNDYARLYQNRVVQEEDSEISFEVLNSWGSGFTGQITIKNISDVAIENWELRIKTNFSFNGFWAGDMTQDGEYVLIRGTYNSYIAPNSSITLGFNGVPGDSNPAILVYELEINK